MKAAAVILLSAAMLLAFATACKSPPGPTRESVTDRDEANSPIRVGHIRDDLRALALFALKDVNVVPVAGDANAKLIQSLAHGDVDAAYVDPVAACLAASEGSPISIVAGACRGGLAFVVRKAEIQRPVELAGEAVALAESGTAAHFFLHRRLLRHKLDGRVYIVPMSIHEMDRALEQHQVDGAVCFDPKASSLLTNPEFGILDDQMGEDESGARPLTCCLAVRKGDVAAVKDRIAALVRAHAAATDSLADRRTSADLASRTLSVEPAAAMAMLERAVFTAEIDEKELEAAAGFLRESNMAAIEDPAAFVASLIDRSFQPGN